MKCACCSKKKKLFESFEELEKDVSICVDCSKVLYKYQDAVKEKNTEETKKFLDEINAKKQDKKFVEWFMKFQGWIGVNQKDVD